MRYRITVTTVQRVIIEGEGPLAFAEDRVSDCLMGYISEADHEVSSYHSDKPTAKLEVLIPSAVPMEDDEVWAEVSG